MYHFAIVDQLNNYEEAESEQEVLDDYELKVMEMIHCMHWGMGSRAFPDKGD